MTFNYFISLGSNIEPRLGFLSRACDQLALHGTIQKKSSLYQTEPWGNKIQSEFINAVIEFDSTLPPQNLLKEIKNIEIFIGRQNGQRWGPREIDIDILFCGNHCIDLEFLQIPHRRFSERRFVLEPMSEINNCFTVPPDNKTILYYLDTCTDQSYIKKIQSEW